VVVVTTTIVGDLATRVVGDDAVVEALIPAGADPCLYEPTSEQAGRLLEAELIVSSGLGLETGLAEALGEAERRGVPTLQLGDELYPLDMADDTDETLDPYWWMDPLRAAGAVTLIADRMLGIRDGDWIMRALETNETLCALDDELRDVLRRCGSEPRRLITNGPGLGYFAERYDCIITNLDLSPVESLGPSSVTKVPTMADAWPEGGESRVSQNELRQRGASLVNPHAPGGVSAEVVSVYVDSLGAPGSGAETYEDMMRTNADRIAHAGQNVLVEWVHPDA
jgi:zinc/manganese transport system substrate-binding protein